MQLSDFEERRYYGCSDQVYGIKSYRRIDGKAQGVMCVDLYNKNGLELTVVPDRGMDILSLRFRGTNIGFLSKTGLVGSRFFVEDADKGFMRNFFAGFLTTGGLSYMGASDEGHGLHGTVSNTPAYEVSFSKSDKFIAVSGYVKEAQVFGAHLVLHRKIAIGTATSCIEINDEVTNEGFEKSPLMLLYHLNYGYPFLSPGLEVRLPESDAFERAGQPVRQTDTKSLTKIGLPVDGGGERVVFHKLQSRGVNEYVLKNRQLGIEVKVSFSSNQLPYLNQWQSFVSGDYVLGLEPSTNNVNGFENSRVSGELNYLSPGETKKFKVKVQLSNSENKS